MTLADASVGRCGDTVANTSPDCVAVDVTLGTGYLGASNRPSHVPMRGKMGPRSPLSSGADAGFAAPVLPAADEIGDDGFDNRAISRTTQCTPAFLDLGDAVGACTQKEPHVGCSLKRSTGAVKSRPRRASRSIGTDPEDVVAPGLQRATAVDHVAGDTAGSDTVGTSPATYSDTCSVFAVGPRKPLGTTPDERSCETLQADKEVVLTAV